MDDMDEEFRRLFRDVAPSVVIVEQVGRIDYYCIGSVLLSDGDTTLIVTQSKILDGNTKLTVRFHDSTKQSASCLLRHDSLCILKTSFYKNCKPVEFFDGEINHTFAAAIAPASKSSVYNLQGYIVHESLRSSRDNGELVENSEHYFTFDCLYGDKSGNGVSRMLLGPVFGLDRKVLGFIARDMSYHRLLELDQNKTVHKDFYAEVAFRFKTVIDTRHLQVILRSVVEDQNWKNVLISKAKGE